MFSFATRPVVFLVVALCSLIYLPVSIVSQTPDSRSTYQSISSSQIEIRIDRKVFSDIYGNSAAYEEISEKLKDILGQHSNSVSIEIRQSADNKLLKAAIDKLESQNLKTKNLDRSNASVNFNSKNENALAALRRIENTFVIEYKHSNANIPIEFISSKLKSLPWVIYSSVVPDKKFEEHGYHPNDSLLIRQSYLEALNIPFAWEIYNQKVLDGSIDTTQKVTIAVIDTGFDLEHEDLQNVFLNPGENGLDVNGLDKAKNDRDDDGNGYIDDYLGWDFNSSIDDDGDRDPSGGHKHGTHVAGLIAATPDNGRGIAGVGRNFNILPVKIGADDPTDRSIANSYDALLYAALSGADIINCSWGAINFTEAEKDIVEVVSALGSLIIAASGNNSANQPFYPASFKDVISVTALDTKGRKPFFSNYHYTVDISSQGQSVISTIPGNEYERISGTSMAAPIVSAIAGLIKSINPDADNRLLSSAIKSNIIPHSDFVVSDYDYDFRLGKGMLDAKAAVEMQNKSLFTIDELSLKNPELKYWYGDTVRLNVSGSTLANGIEALEYNIVPVNGFRVSGSEYKGQTIQGFDSPANELWVKIESNQFDLTKEILVTASSENELLDYESVVVTVNPSFYDIGNDRITLSINSQGNTGYNDYPKNKQGLGFSIDGINHLFESGIIVATPDGKLSSNLRTDPAVTKNSDFIIENVVSVDTLADGTVIANTTFTDWNSELSYDSLAKGKQLGVRINQKTILPKDDSQFVLHIYDIININDALPAGHSYLMENGLIDSLYFGLFCDWDINIEARRDLAFYDFDKRGIVFLDTDKFSQNDNYSADKSDKAILKLIGGGEVGCYVIDNNSTSNTSIGIYDGFSDKEQFNTVSGGLSRLGSSVTDVSGVLSSGPHYLEPSDTIQLIYAMGLTAIGEDISTLNKTIETFVAENEDLVYGTKVSSNKLSIQAYPNPLEQYSRLIIESQSPGYIDIDIYDMSGRLINTLAKEYFTGKGKFSFSIPTLPSGIYRAIARNKEFSVSLNIISP